MRGTTPTLHCDGDDGFCGAWDVDYYAESVSAIDDVPVTRERRAPGWRSADFEDLCPEHAPASETDTTTERTEDR